MPVVPVTVSTWLVVPGDRVSTQPVVPGDMMSTWPVVPGDHYLPSQWYRETHRMKDLHILQDDVCRPAKGWGAEGFLGENLYECNWYVMIKVHTLMHFQ